MSVVVVAILTPKEGRAPDVLAALAQVSPQVHREEGCELYAAHANEEGLVVMVERWSSGGALQTHSAGAALTRLGELLTDVLAKPIEVHALHNVPLGDPVKGTIQ
ncbi:MAG TPA: antibiotic biosynthesis monooxygenase [Lacisediminihabitans sp.]|uniref:putative quinol monooxygenase n=1 Tax=Lacisediminihabitans sp. TaxID=2787631 RepID=UPI002EDA24A7